MSLEELHEQIKQCKKCPLWRDAKNVVVGEGHKDAKVMLVGQNPGKDEDASGRPFVGRSGKFLTNALAEHSIDRSQIFITNIVKHVTPQNRKPTAAETQACLPHLQAQIRLIQPKIIILVGASARETPREKGIEYIEIIHPSAAMRFTKMHARFEEQIKTLSKRLQAFP
ncbi:MAG: uracil-DNA glycosylase [Candidatus Bathyarchaeota archaeon]|nr:uracil-DNA glycosylase [Candidatus Bathyarchaeota archaeon]